ncbi:MAG: hypothetical protein WDM86_14605 [Rhizomicrobium sp.]
MAPPVSSSISLATPLMVTGTYSSFLSMADCRSRAASRVMGGQSAAAAGPQYPNAAMSTAKVARAFALIKFPIVGKL